MPSVVPSRDLWEATTSVLEVGHDAGLVMRRGLEALCTLLAADRADGGHAHTGQTTYRPSWAVSVGDDPPSSFALPLDDQVLRQVLATPRTFVVHDVREELGSSTTGQVMTELGTRAMVVRRLERAGDGNGVICVDWVDRPAELDSLQVALVEEFVTKVLQPVLRQARSQPRHPDPLATLSDAESDVARLAAAGLTYREIADSRGTSINTVGHQLAAARRKLGVANTAALCRVISTA
ncbi:helix-turn-helix transcriptional regulator [Euzebya tangerina]|uniref:helix-turn-helix transcriptional regulator n=1 Tax=Euzebya tangerina TaxID=591198 RepID=UPI000E30ED03|nr:LuxR family transcriptional regulator [Euzebya tangerina]